MAEVTGRRFARANLVLPGRARQSRCLDKKAVHCGRNDDSKEPAALFQIRRV
jgi:hypothetical protein